MCIRDRHSQHGSFPSPESQSGRRARRCTRWARAPQNEPEPDIARHHSAPALPARLLSVAR
eukprot:7977075-Alexandrium_andersonii.AAC.1